MSNIRDIAEGFFNSITNQEEQLYTDRIKICRDCKLWIKDSVFGEMCNKNLCVNSKTGEVSKDKKPGFVCGCGCVLRAKTRVPQMHCPLARW